MCKCDPRVRTPYCGAEGCTWPEYSKNQKIRDLVERCASEIMRLQGKTPSTIQGYYAEKEQLLDMLHEMTIHTIRITKEPEPRKPVEKTVEEQIKQLTTEAASELVFTLDQQILMTSIAKEKIKHTIRVSFANHVWKILKKLGSTKMVFETIRKPTADSGTKMVKVEFPPESGVMTDIKPVTEPKTGQAKPKLKVNHDGQFEIVDKRFEGAYMEQIYLNERYKEGFELIDIFHVPEIHETWPEQIRYTFKRIHK